MTIRLTREIAAWLEEQSAKTGMPQGRIVRDQLQRAKETGARQSFMRLAGCLRGAPDLSRRKGFSRS